MSQDLGDILARGHLRDGCQAAGGLVERLTETRTQKEPTLGSSGSLQS